jgi:DNA-binding SARP family transcriptional activator
VVRFGVLGPLTVHCGDSLVRLPGPRQYKLLAALLLAPNSVVAVSRLVDVVWGADPPANATKQVRNGVSMLRTALGAAAAGLTTSAAGYRLDATAAELDSLAFARHVARARRLRDEGRPGDAEQAYADALALWRGPALSGVDSPALEPAAHRLDEARVTAEEEHLELRIELGAHRDAMAPLLRLVEEHPLRERGVALLMVALYRDGRQVEALEAYRRLWQRLDQELGIVPSAALAELHERILRGEPDPLAPAAAPRPAPPVPRQLPAAPGQFHGRTADLDRLGELRRAAPAGLIVISGTPGVGKTALALHWCHAIAGEYPDGQLQVDLRGYDAYPPLTPAEVLGRFLRALGVPGQAVAGDPGEAAALYRTLLADRRVLVLLDNAERAEQVRPLLTGAPGCLTVVTSRDRLTGLAARDGAQRLALDVLPPREARELLAARVGEQRLAAEPAAADELVAACARLPLALCIAGALLADSPARSLADYLTELDTATPVAALSVDGDPDTAVRATLDRSYHALPARAARLFALLGLHPGADIGTSAAAALAGSGDPAPQLATLVRAHLAEQHGDRYARHDLLRGYAAELAQSQLRAGEREAATGRLLAWYLGVASAAGRALMPWRRVDAADTGIEEFTNPDAALGFCEAERANLVAVVRHAEATGAYEVAWRLPLVLTSFYMVRSYWDDWLDTHATALTAAQVAGDATAQASVLNSLGACLTDSNRPVLAIERLAEALRTAPPDWSGRGAALLNLGRARLNTGRADECVAHVTAALEVFLEQGDRYGQGRALQNLGQAYAAQDRADEALPRLEEALRIFDDLDNGFGRALALDSLGLLHHSRGDLPRARQYLHRSLSVRRGIGHRYGEAVTLSRLGDLLASAGSHAAARDSWQEAAAILDGFDAARAAELRLRAAAAAETTGPRFGTGNPRSA